MTVSLDRVPAIIQAPGALDQLGQLAARLGEGAPVLLVADPGLAFFGLTPRAETSLRGAGLSVSVYTSIKSDPATSQIDTAVALAQMDGARVVVALGGGSAMDAGKAVAAIAGGSAPAAHYAAGGALPTRPLAKICVPTTSGTGSETTRGAVLTAPDGSRISLWGDALKADAVVLDPTLTVDLPAQITAATGLGALTHAIEACTNARATSANDMFCHEAMRLIGRHLPTAVARPADLAARAALQWAAALAGIGIDNAGTAIAHTLGHALVALRPIHPGRALSLALLATLAWSAEHDPDGRFAAAAAALGAEPNAAALAPAFERLLRGVGVKVSLGGEGHDDLKADRLAAEMARPDNVAGLRGHARPVTENDMLAFAQRLLTQR